MQEIKRRILSFAYAFRGMWWALCSQVNFRIHFLMALVVIIAAVAFKLGTAEWAALILCIGGVMSAELINTALEVFANKIHPGFDKEIGKAKDLAAAAVLVMALAAIIVGLIIFIPHVIKRFQ